MAYNRPPYGGPPYGEPPYAYGGPGGYGGPRGPPPRGPPQRPPGPAPPPGPPPPLPPGWYQEWDANNQRAFWVEEATGRSQWENPYPPTQFDRGMPPPVPPMDGGRGYYRDAPPPPPPQGGYDYYQRGQDEQPQKRSIGMGKMFAAGAAGVALGAVGGALLEHELNDHDDGPPP
ncbi:hypothetical protein ASPZODRAFT_234263 [Penicilliopsis zonata CBS 506.65]|uniref:WW domain-containing protein n=1 Tax=Penicilliopsis zonata CBS 506.65 TaxID=1073090 RepID=A0A1L9STZ0_9EURO|nr:hypothetical protein ASPZODRAFT_234263 [Penicilliopsis zonata CBS 506.65]OJJ50672.1 hypothetical protein ASPZODRAFT_234263 [Penicilliopsis zonata CBS 506.65]